MHKDICKMCIQYFNDVKEDLYSIIEYRKVYKEYKEEYEQYLKRVEGLHVNGSYHKKKIDRPRCDPPPRLRTKIGYYLSKVFYV